MSGPSRGRNNLLQKLCMERGLLTIGFRLALRELVERLVEPERVEFVYEEWFGDCDVLPAAWSITGSGDGAFDYTVHVYEIEWSKQIDQDKLAFYSFVADGDGPHFEVHLIDRFGFERVIAGMELMSYWSSSKAHRKTDPVFVAKVAAERLNDRSKRKYRKHERAALALEICEQLGIKL